MNVNLKDTPPTQKQAAEARDADGDGNYPDPLASTRSPPAPRRPLGH
jgi:hypothetical protein